MHRRDFVRSTSALALLPALDACARRVPLASDGRPAAPEGTPIRRDRNGHWRDIAAYARWSPSPHNTQPWRLHVRSSTRADLYYDPRRLLPTTDPAGAFSVLGLAMFIEYARVAAAGRQLSLIDETPARSLDFFASRPVLVSQLELAGTAPSPEFDRRLLLERRTSRLPFDGTSVEDEALCALEAIARDHGHDLRWSSDPELVQWVLELNRFTLFSDLEDAPTRTELQRWMRYTAADARARPDGLSAHCMRFPGWLMRHFFEDHARWGHGWRARMCGDLLLRGMRGTRTVAWWSGPFDTPAAWHTAGRVMARTWLELTRRGIALHPFGSIITNQRANSQLVSAVSPSTAGGRPWLIVRLGRSATPPRSHRLDPGRIFAGEEELA